MAQSELVSPTNWGQEANAEIPRDSRTEAELALEKFQSERIEAQSGPKVSDKPKEVEGNKGDDKGTSITNHGSIKEMRLPHGWHEATAGSDQSVVRSERIFRHMSAGSKEERKAKPADDDPSRSGETAAERAKNSELVLFYSGRPTDEADGTAFRKVLQAAPHRLNADELKSLERTMGDLSDKDSFYISEASTRDINGKRVLDVQGIWLYNKYPYHGLVIDGDGTGKVVQQIYLMAPESEFSARNKDFEQACSTIKWR